MNRADVFGGIQCQPGINPAMKRSETITGDTLIEELLEQHPSLAGVFVRIGLPCFTCGEPAWGTVAELCRKHDRDLGEVLTALNAAVAKPGKPRTRR